MEDAESVEYMQDDDENDASFEDMEIDQSEDEEPMNLDSPQRNNPRRSNQAPRRNEISSNISPSNLLPEGTKRNRKPRVDPYFQNYASVEQKPQLIHVFNTMEDAQQDRPYRIH